MGPDVSLLIVLHSTTPFFVPHPDDDDYIRAGFLTLQNILDKQYFKYQNLATNYEVWVSSMPNLEVVSMDSHRLIYFGTLCSIIFNVVLLSTFVVPFVEEKQNGLKEFLNLVTPMSFLNGLTFFLIRFVFYATFLLFVLIVAYLYQALNQICFAYVAILYLLYVVATMSYAYLISVCFHSGKQSFRNSLFPITNQNLFCSLLR